jgi:hypothetical protein
MAMGPSEMRLQMVRGNCEPDAACDRKGVDFEDFTATLWADAWGASVQLCTGTLTADCAELQWRIGTATALMRGRRRESRKAYSRATSRTVDRADESSRALSIPTTAASS